jgi:CheY-like chemotaxis protein
MDRCLRVAASDGLPTVKETKMSAHKKVMFVDDEEGVRLSWNRYLSAHGFDVTTAEDGEKAISKLRHEPVDVVVSDLKMPSIDGIELLEWIHDEQPETRFILLTGYGNESVERRVRELGAFEYLNKPISPDTLAAVVTAATILKLIPDPVKPVEAEATAVAVEAVEAPALVEREAVVGATPEKRNRLWALVEVPGGLILAPLLGLAFVIALPFIGFGALFYAIGQKIRRGFKPVAA